MWLFAPGIQFLLDGEWSFCLSPFFGHELDNLFGKLKVESGKWKAKNGKWKVDLTPILLSKSRKSAVFSTKLQRSPSISTVLAWLCSLKRLKTALEPFPVIIYIGNLHLVPPAMNLSIFWSLLCIVIKWFA